jgi:hypothetical protein
MALLLLAFDVPKRKRKKASPRIITAKPTKQEKKLEDEKLVKESFKCI